MIRRKLAATACFVLGLVLLSLSRPERAPAPLTIRLLGPLAELAADVQWVRFQHAVQNGEEERALLLAGRALRLDPRATEGWKYLASHLALFLSSPEREPDRDRRAAWLRAGLEVTRRGAEHAAEPGELAMLRGIIALTKSETDPDVLPGGVETLLDEAERAFAAAREAGIFGAEELELQVRER